MIPQPREPMPSVGEADFPTILVNSEMRHPNRAAYRAEPSAKSTILEAASSAAHADIKAAFLAPCGIQFRDINPNHGIAGINPLRRPNQPSAADVDLIRLLAGQPPKDRFIVCQHFLEGRDSLKVYVRRNLKSVPALQDREVVIPQ